MKQWAVVFMLFFMLTGCSTSSGGSRAPERETTRERASAKVHTELAGLYYERAQMGTALGEIELALQADHDYAPAYNVRGLIHMALREDASAEEDFQRSLRIDENNSEAHNNYGWFMCQRGRENDSIPQFMAALKNPLYETPERAYLNAGVCSRKAGNNADAEEFLLQALRIQPNLAPAQVAMAELKFASGDYVAAKKFFTKYSEKNDNLTAEQLWLAVRIERKAGDRNAAASYGLQLRKRYPDAHETQLLMQGE